LTNNLATEDGQAGWDGASSVGDLAEW
jgi:hypothetical protein